MAGTCTENGELQNIPSSNTVGIKGVQEKVGTAKENWMSITRRDMKDMDTSWKEAEKTAADRIEWCQRVAQCIHQDSG